MLATGAMFVFWYGLNEECPVENSPQAERPPCQFRGFGLVSGPTRHFPVCWKVRTSVLQVSK